MSQTRGGVAVGYTYDNAGRPTLVTGPGTQSRTLTWSTAGLLLQSTNEKGLYEKTHGFFIESL